MYFFRLFDAILYNFVTTVFVSNINTLQAKSLLICCNECNKLIGIFVALRKRGVSLFKSQCATYCTVQSK